MAEQGGRGVMLTRVGVAGTIGWMVVLDCAKEFQGPICGRGSNTNGWSHIKTWLVAKYTGIVVVFIKRKHAKISQLSILP